MAVLTQEIDISKLDSINNTIKNNNSVTSTPLETTSQIENNLNLSNLNNKIDVSKLDAINKKNEVTFSKLENKNKTSVPLSNQPTTAEKIAYGIDKQNMFFGNVWRASKAGVEALFDPDREFKEVMLEDTAKERAELFKRHKKFSTGLYDEDIEVLAAEMATFMVDPYYIFMYATPWGRAMSMRQQGFKGVAKFAGLSAGSVSLDKLFDNLVTTGEANPKSVAEAGALAGVLGPASMKAFQIIGKLLPKADKAKIAQVVGVIQNKTRLELGVTKAEFKVLQKIAGDKEFLKLNKQIIKDTNDYRKIVNGKQEESLKLANKVEEQITKLTADKKLIKSDVIGLIDKKKASQSITDKILKIKNAEKLRVKTFDKAQTKLWESTAATRKSINDANAKRDVLFLEKLWKEKSLTEKTAQALLSASVKPLMGAGIGWSLGKLWGPEDTNLGTWMMVGASLGATQKAIQASKILPGQSKNLLQRIIYRDAIKFSFQKARELTSTTTSSKLAAIGGETEQIGLQLLEGIDSSFARSSVTQRADTLLRTWQRQAFDIIQRKPGQVYSQADQDLALAIVRGSKTKGNPAANQLAKRIETELKNFKRLYNDAGIFSLDDKGKLVDIEKYFPRVYDYDAITKDPKKFAKVIFDIFKSLGKSDKKAKQLSDDFALTLRNEARDDTLINQDVLTRLINNNLDKKSQRIYGRDILKNNPLSQHITNSRILQGPYAKVEKVLVENGYLKKDIVGTLNNLYTRSMKSIAFAEKFGPQGQLLKPYLTSIIKKYKDSGVDNWANLANKEINISMDVVDAFFDRYGRKVSQTEKTTAGIISTISNLNMLDRVTIASLGDIAQPWTNSNNIFAFFQGAMRTGFTNKRESGVAKNMNLYLSREIKDGLLQATGTGQQFDDATKAANVMGKMGVVRAANEFGFKYLGLQWLTGLARRYAYNVGAVDAYTSANKLAKFVSANNSLSSSKGLKLVRDINRYSLNVEDALKLGKFNTFDDALANKTGNKLLNETGIIASNRDALVPQVQNRLLFTQSRNPWVRLMGQFTSWAMAKSTQTNKVLQRIENGDVKQMVKLLAAIPVYGGIQMLREIAKYGEIKTDPASQEGKWWAEALRLSGMSGILPELVVGRTTGPGASKPWFLPFPAASILEDTGDIFKDALKGNTNKAFRDFMKKIAPFPTWRKWGERLFGGIEKTQKIDNSQFETIDAFKPQKFSKGGRVGFSTGDLVESGINVEALDNINKKNNNNKTLNVLNNNDLYIVGDNLKDKLVNKTEEKIIEQKPMNKKDITTIASAAVMAATGATANIDNEVNNYVDKIKKYEGTGKVIIVDGKKYFKNYRLGDEEFITSGYGFYNKDNKEDGMVSEEKAMKDLKNNIKLKLIQTKKNIKNFDSLSNNLKKNIVSSWYRGSLSGSPKTIRLINEGKFKEASVEFLNNAEYKAAVKAGSGMSGVAKRMEDVANAIKMEALKKKEI